MTKDVLVMIAGRQFDVYESPIKSAAKGNYYLKNGKHYVLYEEPSEDGGVIKNRVKFYDGHFEMVKSGAASLALTFNQGEKTRSMYNTSAGGVLMEVETQDIVISEEDEMIHVKVKYALYINGQFISKCEVDFKVRNR